MDRRTASWMRLAHSRCARVPEKAAAVYGGPPRVNWKNPRLSGLGCARNARVSPWAGWAAARASSVGRLRAADRGERKMAGLTGLEPATSCVTGRRSNQLNYNPAGAARADRSQAAAPKSRGRIAAAPRPVKDPAPARLGARVTERYRSHAGVVVREDAPRRAPRRAPCRARRSGTARHRDRSRRRSRRPRAPRRVAGSRAHVDLEQVRAQDRAGLPPPAQHLAQRRRPARRIVAGRGRDLEPPHAARARARRDAHVDRARPTPPRGSATPEPRREARQVRGELRAASTPRASGSAARRAQ